MQNFNEPASAHMNYHIEVVVIPSASHLFEESGTLQTAAELARDWFRKYHDDVARV